MSEGSVAGVRSRTPRSLASGRRVCAFFRGLRHTRTPCAAAHDQRSDGRRTVLLRAPPSICSPPTLTPNCTPSWSRAHGSRRSAHCVLPADTCRAGEHLELLPSRPAWRDPLSCIDLDGKQSNCTSAASAAIVPSTTAPAATAPAAQRCFAETAAAATAAAAARAAAACATAHSAHEFGRAESRRALVMQGSKRLMRSENCPL